MSRFVSFYDTWSSRINNALGLWPLLAAISTGLVTAFGSQNVAWINQFGWFGWWCAFLVGFFIFSGGAALLGFARERFALAVAARRWTRNAEDFNPLDKVFQGQRLLIEKLAHPITGGVIAKTFRDCELIGPRNLMLLGCTVQDMTFTNCEYIVIRDDAIPRNVTVIKDCHLYGGEIWSCTIFLNQASFDDMRAHVQGIEGLTYERPNA